MQYDSTKHHRRSIRLKGSDYSQAGFYFVTICCDRRQQLFGEIVKSEWLKSSVIRPGIKLDEYVVMPNHFHGIVIINHGRI